MTTSAAKTVPQYLATLDAARRAEVERARALVNASLPRGYLEVMQYGMISWVVPPARLDKTYNGQPLAIAALAAQKNYLALYLLGLYSAGPVRARFDAAYKASGKKPDIGKSCLRFNSVDDLAQDAVRGALAALDVDAFVALYERTRGARTSRPANKKAASKKAAGKKAANKKAANKKSAKKNAAKKAAKKKNARA